MFGVQVHLQNGQVNCKVRISSTWVLSLCHIGVKSVKSHPANPSVTDMGSLTATAVTASPFQSFQSVT